MGWRANRKHGRQWQAWQGQAGAQRCCNSTHNTQPNTTLRHTSEHVQVAVLNSNEVVRGPKLLGRSNTLIDK
jgi:hypothetical protein